ELTWWHAGITPRLLARDCKRARERAKRDHDPGQELGRHLLEIEIEIFDLPVRIDIRELAEHAWHIEVRGVGARHDLVERDLQHVARLRLLDVNRSSQRVRSASRKVRA